MAQANPAHYLLFTEPWEPVSERRGDALGLLALSETFADSVAPDFSNRIRDGRWVTILSWCLVRSQAVFDVAERGLIAPREFQRSRYSWLRPLELQWVARTIALAQDDWRKRSLAGQRRVRPWLEARSERGGSIPRFSMSDAQYRAYRQTGMYGGYRLAFRRWPGLTRRGDGWTPDRRAAELAAWLDEHLGAAEPSWPLVADMTDGRAGVSARKPGKYRAQEDQWWVRSGWGEFDSAGRYADRNTLPRRRDDYSVLPEAKLLHPLLFEEGPQAKRRLEVLEVIRKSRRSDHLSVCKDLGEVLHGDEKIWLLPHFSWLADAGMSVMDLFQSAPKDAPRLSLTDIAKAENARERCQELSQAAANWKKVRMSKRGGDYKIRHIERADRFADCIASAKPQNRLEAIASYHVRYGGGLRWFQLRNGEVEYPANQRAGSSRYRFRLWSLCRLAVQCGALSRMPKAFKEQIEEQAIDTSDEENDDSDSGGNA